MPRRIDPSNINVGKGRVPQGTVADNSLRQPNRDIDPLRVHIQDPSRAHTASAIGIVDAADCFVSDEVEGALQEICSGAAAGRLNGLVEGGRFDEVIAGLPSASLVLTLESVAAGNNDTVVLVGAGAVDVSGLTVTLVDNATQYIYLDTNSANPTYLQLVASNSLPEVETAAGIEDILFAEVTTLAGSVTAYTDARFFVRNLDRKVTYSSRQGEDVDSWSQGCFATLDAFFFWKTNYGSTLGTGEEDKGTIFLRGEHVLDSTLSTNGVQWVEIKGDGHAVLVASGTFTDTVLFDASFSSDLTIEGVEFRNDSPTSGMTAFFMQQGSKQVSIEIRNCYWSTGGNGFATAIQAEHSIGSAQKILIEDNVIFVEETDAAIKVDGTQLTTIRNNRISGPGESAVGSIGIQVGSFSSGTEFAVISNNQVRRFETGCVLGSGPGASDGVSQLKMEGNYFEELKRGVWCDTGVPVASPGSPTCRDFLISGNTFALGDDGEFGIYLKEVPVVTITNNHLKTDKVSFGGITPVGIGLDTISAGSGGLNGVPLDTTIADNTVDGFLDRSTGSGFAVAVTAENGNPALGVSITGNQLLESGIFLLDDVRRFTVSDNNMTGYLDEVPDVQLNAPTAIVALGSNSGVPSVGVVSNNRISRFGSGIALRGGTETLPVSQVEVIGNQVSECFFIQDNLSDTWDTSGVKGIGLEYCEYVTITDNQAESLGGARNNLGVDITPQGNVYTTGVYARNCSQVTVSDNRVDRSRSFGIGFVFAGVYFTFNDPGGATIQKYRGFNVIGNSIAVGDPNVDQRYGIAFNTPDGFDLESGQVKDNLISLTGEAGTNGLTHGIRCLAQEVVSTNSKGGVITDWTLSNNEVSGANSQGIDVDLRPGGTQAFATALASLTISSNKVFMTGAGRGIRIWTGSDGVLGSLTNVINISGNEISEANEGVLVRSAGTAGALSSIREVRIDENRLYNCTIGIDFRRIGPNDDNDKDLRICNNEVLYGSSIASGALRVTLGENSFEELVVDGNLLIGLEDEFGSVVLIEADGVGEADKTLRNFSFSDNQVRTDIDDALGNKGVSITVADFQLFSLRIDNNRVLGGSDTGGAQFKNSFEIVASATTNAAPFYLSGATVSGNILNGGPLKVDLTDYGLSGTAVTNNVVTCPSFAAAAPTTGAIDLEGSDSGLFVLGLITLDVSVTGNKTLGGSKGISWNFTDYASMTGTSISDNMISGPRTGSLLQAGYGIYLVSGQGENTFRDFKVDGNQITGCEQGQHISIDVSSPDPTDIDRFSVSGNQLTGPTATGLGTENAALRFRAVAAPGSSLVNLIVEDNTVGANAQGAGPLRGIHVIGPQDITSTNFTIANVSISRNKLYHQYAEAESGFGIYSEFHHQTGGTTTPPGDMPAGTGVAAYTIQALKLDDNQILSRVTGSPGAVGGILAECTCAIRGLSISNNVVRGSIGDDFMGDPGIRLYHEFIASNGYETDTAGNSEIYVVGVPGGALTTQMVVDDPGTLQNWSPTTWRNVKICGNSITWKTGWNTVLVPSPNPYDAALTIGHYKESTRLGPVSTRIIVPLWGFTMTGNMLESNKGNGSATREAVGFTVGILIRNAAWVGQTAVSSTAFWQRGWSISGNSASDFRWRDTGTATSYGQCVLNWTGVSLTNAAVEGNFANDSDPAGLTGWDEVKSLAATNENDGVRPFA